MCFCVICHIQAYVLNFSIKGNGRILQTEQSFEDFLDGDKSRPPRRSNRDKPSRTSKFNFTQKKLIFKILTGLGGRSGRERVSANDIQPEASDMMNNLVESDAQPVQM